MRLTRNTLLPPPGEAPLPRALNGIEEQHWLDPAVNRIQHAVRVLPPGDTRDLLRGTWLGHPLHPTLVQLPVGCWLSAAVLDLVPGEQPAATGLVALGLAGALPAAVAGWVDWAELDERRLRLGLVHVVANTTGIALYTASLTSRLRGKRAAGRLLAYLGLSAVAVGGVLGGHLAYRQVVGADAGGFPW
ncbi:DUF2231 domain-containing protein [Kitasatospora sp. NPDC050543]|uniref:DUF2231 domain-containing protein n=1 Tax=Kitasatospora sp. NPDC050543 TaxID=3364054 RepID=UPI0037B4EF04